MLFTITGYVAWGLFALFVFAALLRALWDGYRALTVLQWVRGIQSVKGKKFPAKAQAGFFFRQWRDLLFTWSGQITMSGPDGYWREHNDWEVSIPKEVKS
jgi:hypothetical protein